MSRDIPKLSTIILKEIARYPVKYLSANDINYNSPIFAKIAGKIDIAQVLVDYITESGRLVDDVIPVNMFKKDRTQLTLKNAKLSPTYISKIIEQCIHLEYIDLSGTFQIDDDLILLIIRKCPALKTLNIRNCRKLTNLALKHISDSKASKLTSLHIGGSVNIHESGLISFLKSSNASKLNELNISGLPVNDTTLTLLLKHCPQLTKLGVNFGHISESAMRAFLSTELGSRLEALHLAWVGTQSSTTGMVESSSPEKDPYSTDFFSDFLATTCPLLTELDVSGMKGANASSLQLYLDQRWRQVDISGGVTPNLQQLKAKYVGSSRGVLEQLLLQYNITRVEL